MNRPWGAHFPPPNFPVPLHPPPNPDFSFPLQNLPNPPSIHDQKKIDKDFIENLVKGAPQRTLKADLTINEAKTLLTNLIKKKEYLKAVCIELEPDDEDYETKWKDSIEKQKEINADLSKFNDTTINKLKKAIENRRKKREKMKNKHQNMKKDSKERIKTKNKIIDKIVLKEKEEVERIKRNESIKRQADAVLQDVLRKKTEAKKIINMLAALHKLRELRSAEEVKQGGFCSTEVRETFNSVIEHFKSRWEKQMEGYKVEETGLKAMLDESESQKTKQIDLKFCAILHQWEKALFGDDFEHGSVDLKTFVKVRRDWDEFIVSPSVVLSSSIPEGWVLPPETENEEWKTFANI